MDGAAVGDSHHVRRGRGDDAEERHGGTQCAPSATATLSFASHGCIRPAYERRSRYDHLSQNNPVNCCFVDKPALFWTTSGAAICALMSTRPTTRVIEKIHFFADRAASPREFFAQICLRHGVISYRGTRPVQAPQGVAIPSLRGPSAQAPSLRAPATRSDRRKSGRKETFESGMPLRRVPTTSERIDSSRGARAARRVSPPPRCPPRQSPPFVCSAQRGLEVRDNCTQPP